MRHFIRLSLPPLLAIGLMLVLVGIAAAAPGTTNNPGGITTGACTFANGWYDNLSRWFFGLSLILLLLAGLMSLRNMHTEGPWGAVIAIAGVGVLIGLVGLLPMFAGGALAAAGAPGC